MKLLRYAAMAALASFALAGCSTYDALTGSGSAAPALCSTPSQCIYQAKGVFAAALAFANGYGSLPVCPVAAPVCKDETLVAQLKTEAHSIKDTLDAADELVNSGLLPNGQKATETEIEANVAGASKAADDFRLSVASLPHK